MTKRTRMAICLAAVIACAGAVPAFHAAAAEGELPAMIFEEGFEEGLEAWGTHSEAEYGLADTQPHGGNQCARIVVPEGTPLAYQQLYRKFGPVTEGDEFRVSVWVRAENVTGGSGAYCALQFIDDVEQRKGIIHSKISEYTGLNGWEELTLAGRAPAGVTQGRLDLILHAEGSAWFDDVKVEKIGELEPWPDLGNARRTITIETDKVVHPNFGGIGFHVFHHSFPAPQEDMDTVIAKRWREINPSFARMNHDPNWTPEELAGVAEHMLRLKGTGTEIYMATWGPKDVPAGPERDEYVRSVVDHLEYFVKEKGATNLKYYCMSNELTLGQWGRMAGDMETFKDYHQRFFDELKKRDLDIALLASDASPVSWWHTVEWSTKNMDDITGVYGGHHYINDYDPSDVRFYPWFLSRLEWGAQVARRMNKDFILGEFGTKQDGRVVNGKKLDRCIYWDTPKEPLVGIQLSDAAIAAMNAGIYSMANWTYMDFPDYSNTYENKWGMFKRTEGDYSTRDHYYCYGLLTKFFRGPATVYKVECEDPYVRAAALQHHGDDSYSIAVLNRYEGDFPVDIALAAAPAGTAFRKYVYDPANVPQNPFGDLQAPSATVTVKDGRLSDTLKAGTLTVYTTACDDEPPGAVKGLRTGQTDEGHTLLQWDGNAEADLCYYRVYSSNGAACEPVLANQIASTIATEFIDRRPAAEGRRYLVVAVDQSGNAGRTE